jgi:hypothetical protein
MLQNLQGITVMLRTLVALVLVMAVELQTSVGDSPAVQSLHPMDQVLQGILSYVSTLQKLS